MQRYLTIFSRQTQKPYKEYLSWKFQVSSPGDLAVKMRVTYFDWDKCSIHKLNKIGMTKSHKEWPIKLSGYSWGNKYLYMLSFREGIERLYALSFLWMKEASSSVTICVAILVSLVTGWNISFSTKCKTKCKFKISLWNYHSIANIYQHPRSLCIRLQ